MATGDIGPIRVEVDPSRVRFTFTNPKTITLEIPVSLEEEITAFLAEQGDLSGRDFIIDLEELPAVSSRQLGITLTIRKICEPLGTVKMVGVSDGVRYLLDLTRMSQYFNL